MELSIPARNAACNAITALFNVGGAGKLRIFEGTMPSSVNDSEPGSSLLVSLPLNATAFGAATSGTAVANAISNASITQTGTAAWFRLTQNNLAGVIQGSVGLASPPSGADIEASSVDFVSGGIVSVTSLTLTVPST
jgi:hypothetical protein